MGMQWDTTITPSAAAQRRNHRFKRHRQDLAGIPLVRRWRPMPEELLSIVASWVVIITVGLAIWLVLTLSGLATAWVS